MNKQHKRNNKQHKHIYTNQNTHIRNKYTQHVPYQTNMSITNGLQQQQNIEGHTVYLVSNILGGEDAIVVPTFPIPLTNENIEDFKSYFDNTNWIDVEQAICAVDSAKEAISEMTYESLSSEQKNEVKCIKDQIREAHHVENIHVYPLEYIEAFEDLNIKARIFDMKELPA